MITFINNESQAKEFIKNKFYNTDSNNECYVLCIGKEGCPNCIALENNLKTANFEYPINIIFIHLENKDCLDETSYFNQVIVDKYPEIKNMISMPILLFCDKYNKVLMTRGMSIITRTIKDINNFARGFATHDKNDVEQKLPIEASENSDDNCCECCRR